MLLKVKHKLLWCYNGHLRLPGALVWRKQNALEYCLKELILKGNIEREYCLKGLKHERVNREFNTHCELKEKMKHFSRNLGHDRISTESFVP